MVCNVLIFFGMPRCGGCQKNTLVPHLERWGGGQIPPVPPPGCYTYGCYCTRAICLPRIVKRLLSNSLYVVLNCCFSCFLSNLYIYDVIIFKFLWDGRGDVTGTANQIVIHCICLIMTPASELCIVLTRSETEFCCSDSVSF